MADSIGSGFPNTGINKGHLFFDQDEGALWEYINGPPRIVSSWKLLSGKFNEQPDTSLWGEVQAGATWFLVSDRTPYMWDGTQIVLVGGGSAGYGIFQQNGVSVTQQSILNVVGRNALVDDSGGVTRFRMNDPATMSYVHDDFIGGGQNLGFGGAIGELGWLGGQFGTGVVLIPTLLVADISHPGVRRLSTGAAGGSTVSIALPNTASFNNVLVDAMFDTQWIINLRDSDVNTRVVYGLLPGGAPTALDGVRIEKGFVDTDWFAFCGDSIGVTRISLGAVVVGAWEKFRIRRVDTITIGFTRNAQAEILISTNLPASGVGLGFVCYIENNAAADKNLDVDYFDILVTGLVR